MKVSTITIDHFRSIEHLTVVMPDRKPLILFGPNNAGKSNIIAAIHRILGERYPPYIEMTDSDFFMRDKQANPHSYISCCFDEPISKGQSIVRAEYFADSSQNRLSDSFGKKLFISNEERKQIQSFLVDAERSINYQLSYSSKFTLLSKFSHAVHNALKDDDRSALEAAFETIKNVFSGIPEYKNFTERFASSVSDSVQGFSHKLEVDFSAYDPNNYGNAMRIVAKEGAEPRSFNEFGTGEQQILLIAFAKAYMESFGSESIVLILEEPEAHLHPLAQKWLKEYIYDLCEDGLQIIVSTHSPDFVDPSNLSGIVRVYKDNIGITKTVQLNNDDLAQQCISMGVPASKIKEKGVHEFFQARFLKDDLKGLFAKKVILVEGATEYLSLPLFFKRNQLSLPKEGLEIISCRGKGQIPAYYRLFESFGIECFVIFDADSNGGNNSELMDLLGIDAMSTNGNYVVGDNYLYFTHDYEHAVRLDYPGYSDLEQTAKEEYGASGKPNIARVATILMDGAPSFTVDLTKLFKEGETETVEAELETPLMPSTFDSLIEYDDDIPF